jgi:hypothetical protein
MKCEGVKKKDTMIMNRETWLLSCLEELRPDFVRVGAELPAKIRTSCGWPSKSALARVRQRVGECWSATCSGDETFEIFISPALRDSVEVLATLVHEGVHAAVGVEAKHGSAFRKVAKALNLEGKMTATTAGEVLKVRLKELVTKLGEFPHAELKSSNAPKKQGTRLRKVVCKKCGYAVRVTAKWIEVGLPTCPCGTEMEEDSE